MIAHVSTQSHQSVEVLLLSVAEVRDGTCSDPFKVRVGFLCACSVYTVVCTRCTQRVECTQQAAHTLARAIHSPQLGEGRCPREQFVSKPLDTAQRRHTTRPSVRQRSEADDTAAAEHLGLRPSGACASGSTAPTPHVCAHRIASMQHASVTDSQPYPQCSRAKSRTGTWDGDAGDPGPRSSVASALVGPSTPPQVCARRCAPRSCMGHQATDPYTVWS